MLKKFIKVTAIIMISLILCGFKAAAKDAVSSGKNFILPKTFKINDQFLPPLDLKPEKFKNKPVATVNIPVKAVKTSNGATAKVLTIKTAPVITSKINKPASSVISTQIKKETPVLYKQPGKIQIQSAQQIKPANFVKAQVMIASKKNNTSNSLKSINSVSLTNLIKNYNFSYANTIKSTVTSLSEMQIIPVSYNTEKGQIIAKLASGKELFILIIPYKENYTCVRITPADGNYNLPMTTINEIFLTISNNLQST